MVPIRQARPRRFHWQKFKNFVIPYTFILPYFVLMAFFILYVFFRGAQTSFTDAQSINPGSWIGLQNYKDIIQSKDFWKSVGITFQFTLGSLITQMPAAFIMAYILNGIAKRFRGVLRASFYVPVLINAVAVALMFNTLFNRQFGAINWVMGMLHLPNNIDWLNNSTYSVLIMVLVSFWQWTGYHIVFFLASLQAIDPTIYEVAKLDGASRTRTLFQITVPLMRPAMAFTFVTSAIGSLQLFELPFLLFPNASYGPGGSAKTLVAYIYDWGFAQHFQLGFAAAAGWVVFFIILVISLLQLKFLGLGNADE
jgi:ABC-type sugar transport system permease subunit